MAPGANDSEKLVALKEKIDLAKGKSKEEKSSKQNHKNISYAWRMVLELVIGMLIGVIIGYTIDYFLETAPWMLITMSLFGFGAGIRAMMKTAEELTKSDNTTN
tara:strand:+ start:189 stop:500 length:312 start_codon:yes stop_codon:yes gene_type:complete